MTEDYLKLAREAIKAYPNDHAIAALCDAIEAQAAEIERLGKVAESVINTTYHGHRNDFGECAICKALKDAGYGG